MSTTAGLGDAAPPTDNASLLQRIATIVLVIVMVGFFVYVLVDFRHTWRLINGWGINPWIYGALWLASVPPYWVSIFRIKNGLLARDGATVWQGVALNRTAWAAPYLYAAVVGSGLPGWVRPAMVAYVVCAAIYTVRKLRDPDYISKLTNSGFGQWLASRGSKDTD